MTHLGVNESLRKYIDIFRKLAQNTLKTKLSLVSRPESLLRRLFCQTRSTTLFQSHPFAIFEHDETWNENISYYGFLCATLQTVNPSIFSIHSYFRLGIME